MPLSRPQLYFRRRGNGAVVFMFEETDNGRLEMQQIAVLKPNGDIKPQGDTVLTPDQISYIEEWKQQWADGLTAREDQAIVKLVSDMNEITQWIQSDASNAQVKAHTQSLLMAMYDMRTTLLRRVSKDK